MRSLLCTAVAAIALAASVTACGSSGGAASTKVVKDGAVTIAVGQDPGNLDPQNTVTIVDAEFAAFGYDPLLNENTAGKVVSGLAQKWTQSGNTYRFTLHPGITCSDGTALSATTVAANFTYLADPKNKSPLLGLYVPPGLTATADDGSRTVTLKLTGPFPFFLTDLSAVPIVCQKALDNRKLLAQSTDGTGPYRLAKAVSSDSYTYRVHKGYAWGPGGATTATDGMPATVTFKVVTNPSTAANLLLSGQVNISGVTQPDLARVNAQGLAHSDLHSPAGEMFFNEASGRPTADPDVRRALVMALDLDAIGKVITGGAGQPSHGMVTVDPKPCSGDPVTGNLPAHDPAQAARLLDQAGWVKGANGIRSKDGHPLSLQLIYDSGSDPTASAAELAVSQWRAAGVKVTAAAKPDTQLSSILFSTGAWDISWAQLTVQLPSQLVPLLSGAAPPKGTNFGHLTNADYDRLTTAASHLPNTAGCSDWIAAETALVKAVDVVPYYDQTASTFAKDASFKEAGGLIVPTSIRRLAG